MHRLLTVYVQQQSCAIRCVVKLCLDTHVAACVCHTHSRAIFGLLANMRARVGEGCMCVCVCGLHRNIIRIKGIGAEDLSSLSAARSTIYIVMEALDGGTLRDQVMRQMTGRYVCVCVCLCVCVCVRHRPMLQTTHRRCSAPFFCGVWA